MFQFCFGNFGTKKQDAYCSPGPGMWKGSERRQGLPTLVLYEWMSTGIKQRNMPNKERKGLGNRYYQCWERQHLHKVVKM